MIKYFSFGMAEVVLGNVVCIVKYSFQIPITQFLYQFDVPVKTSKVFKSLNITAKFIFINPFVIFLRLIVFLFRCWYFDSLPAGNHCFKQNFQDVERRCKIPVNQNISIILSAQNLTLGEPPPLRLFSLRRIPMTL